MKILLADLKAKVRREDIFELTIGNESLNETRNDNGISASKNLIINVSTL
jgi:hypothetical protein